MAKCVDTSKCPYCKSKELRKGSGMLVCGNCDRMLDMCDWFGHKYITKYIDSDYSDKMATVCKYCGVHKNKC